MIRNFLFHRVNPQRDPLWDPMEVDFFDKCINYISKKYTIELFEDIALTDKLFTKNKYATIMFDDGYKDNIEFALPILEKYNCKASFYVVTDCIDKNIPTWTHILEYSFQKTNKSKLVIDFDFIPKKLQITELNSREERLNYAKTLKPFLKTIQSAQRKLVLDRIHESFSDVIQEKLMMNWEDLKRLRSKGHYIGSHTVTHNMLGTMENEEEITKELEVSKQRIQEELGYSPITISYPIGSYNDTTKRLAKEVGYKIGLAVHQDIFDPNKQDLFAVSRIELYNEPWFKTKLRISNNLEKIKKLIRYR